MTRARRLTALRFVLAILCVVAMAVSNARHLSPAGSASVAVERTIVEVVSASEAPERDRDLARCFDGLECCGSCAGIRQTASATPIPYTAETRVFVVDPPAAVSVSDLMTTPPPRAG